MTIFLHIIWMSFEFRNYSNILSGWFWRCSLHMQKHRWLYSDWYCFMGYRLCSGPISWSIHSSHRNDWLDSKNYLMLLNKRRISFLRGFTWIILHLSLQLFITTYKKSCNKLLVLERAVSLIFYHKVWINLLSNYT